MDFYQALLGKSLSGGGGGGGSATLITKEITANGTYNASSDNADGYSAVTIDVPNTYTQSDEGKVVDNGTLVAQTSASYDTNGTYDTTTINSVTVNVSTPAPLERSDVNFYDYDGTLVNSYTAQEFLALTAMPANPTHTGLTAQGWNWTLSDAKTYVTSYGKLEIGQNYVTTDGKTKYYITIRDEYKSPTFKIYLNSGASCEIDWGDSTTPDSINTVTSQTRNHTYASSGDYIISVTVSSGTVILQQLSSPYTTCLTKVEIGSGVEAIGTYCFQSCYSLKSVSIPTTVTTIATSAFNLCFSLKSVTIPSGVTDIYTSVFSSCKSLESVTIPSGVTSIGKTVFYDCSVLKSVTIPSRVASIGSDAFNNCSVLKSVTIPSRVTSIGNDAFNNCPVLKSVTIPSGVTSIGSGAFEKCSVLKSVTIPSGVTSIGSDAFRYCYSLFTITIDKAEGSISGSPWGATNATVVWTG